MQKMNSRRRNLFLPEIDMQPNSAEREMQNAEKINKYANIAQSKGLKLIFDEIFMTPSRVTGYFAYTVL